jgi:predicted DNA-binding transcriptional regulator AlpA
MDHAHSRTASTAKPTTELDLEPGFVPVHELMTSGEVATLLGVSQATLCRWRERGTGPPALWLSARMPRYFWNDVQRWMERSRS